MIPHNVSLCTHTAGMDAVDEFFAGELQMCPAPGAGWTGVWIIVEGTTDL